MDDKVELSEEAVEGLWSVDERDPRCEDAVDGRANSGAIDVQRYRKIETSSF